MKPRPADALEVLLPGAPPPLAERAKRLTTFLRLLANDSRVESGASVRVTLEGARGELERQARRRLLAAVLDLARHHLYAALGAESFAWLGEVEGTAQEGWSALEDLREELPWLAVVPEPGEPPLEVAMRLIDSGRRLGLGPGHEQLWRARCEEAARGPAAGEAAFRELLGGAGQSALQRAALAGALECLLDRGAVRAARMMFEERAGWVRADPRLRRLASWTQLLAGDEAQARAVVEGIAPWRGRIPLSLAALREQRPEWLPLLAGRAALARGEPAWIAPRPESRADGGAVLFAVFALRPGGAADAVQLDVAPGLRGRTEGWLRERDGATTQALEPEHRLVATARAVLVQRDGRGALRGALDPQGSRALALAPLLDPGGEVAGWLEIECDHHLLPVEARLERWARAWSEELQRPRKGHESAGEPAFEAIEEGPCARVFRELADSVGMKMTQRRWWGFEVRRGAARLVAEGGSIAASGRAGGRRALSRALRSAGWIGFDEPDPELAIDTGSASGLVLPLRAGGALCGLFAVESARRRDFRPEVAARAAEQAQGQALALRVAQFRGWHRSRFGHDVHLPCASEESRALAIHVLAAGRARGPVVLCGPGGAGKGILARWLHFEGASEEAVLAVHGCGAGADEERELWGPASGRREALFERARGGTLVLDDLERLAAPAQARLVAHLAGVELEPIERTEPRIVATVRRPLEELARDGQLRLDLAQRLQRLQIHVPALHQRREEIPGLAQHLAERFARELRRPEPSFSD
ncbi:MAG TPA: sigma 54-interacting transcriptional regulator, partial [Planctomycetota bacterium]|nr:sigma 54-interacting transcriptional regulator [Planctomycetota bacterium]